MGNSHVIKQQTTKYRIYNITRFSKNDIQSSTLTGTSWVHQITKEKIRADKLSLVSLVKYDVVVLHLATSENLHFSPEKLLVRRTSTTNNILHFRY